MRAVAVGTGITLALAMVCLVAGFVAKPAQRAARRPRSLSEVWSHYTRRPPGRAGRIRDIVLVSSIVAGVVTFILSGWLIAIALVPLAALGLPKILGKAPAGDIQLLEALDRWVRTISATLPVGRDVVQSIRISSASAPPLIAAEIHQLVDQLNNRVPSAVALQRFADSLDNPESDAVLASLILATRRTGMGLTDNLNNLADNIQDRLRALREIEQERDKPRSRVRQITVIAMVMVGAALLLGDYFDPYATPIGQVVLLALLAVYVASLIRMYRMTIPRHRERILVAPRQGTS